jgi:hypothetical protein
MDLKWIIDQNVIQKNIKLLEEGMGESFVTLLEKEFLMHKNLNS